MHTYNRTSKGNFMLQFCQRAKFPAALQGSYQFDILVSREHMEFFGKIIFGQHTDLFQLYRLLYPFLKFFVAVDN